MLRQLKVVGVLGFFGSRAEQIVGEGALEQGLFMGGCVSRLSVLLGGLARGGSLRKRLCCISVNIGSCFFRSVRLVFLALQQLLLCSCNRLGAFFHFKKGMGTVLNLNISSGTVFVPVQLKGSTVFVLYIGGKR